jgi:rhamnulokinase
MAHTEEAARIANYSNEGSVGGAFRLQKNIMGLWMIQQVRREAEDAYSFEELATMARASAVADTVRVNDERFLAPDNMTGEIAAAVGRPLSLGETAYIIYDSLARSYAEAMTELEGITGRRYTTLNIIGGGSKNRFLNGLTANYTKRKIIAGPAEGTAIGNMLMQMIGAGDVKDVAEGRSIVKRSFDIEELEEKQ